MIITINLPDDHAKLLGKWASIARTIHTAESACYDAAGNTNLSSTDQEKYSWCLHELEMLNRPLDNLHQLVRSEIWKQQQPI